MTGAEFYAEMGDFSDFEHAGQLIKMAGTNPIVKQSGGKETFVLLVFVNKVEEHSEILAYQVGKIS